MDAGVSSGFQFQQAVGANRLPIELRVRGITSVGSRAITTFGFKVYDYDTSILSSHSSAVASFTASGRYSGTVSELDGTYNSVVGGLAKVVGADVTATAEPSTGASATEPVTNTFSTGASPAVQPRPVWQFDDSDSDGHAQRRSAIIRNADGVCGHSSARRGEHAGDASV